MSVDEAVKSHLAVSLANFWQVCIPVQPLAAALVATDQLAAAACLSNDLRSIDPLTCVQLRAAIEQATPAITDLMRRAHPPEQVELWMTAAVGLVSGGDPQVHVDRFLYTRLLASHLCVIACRQKISDRGDPLVQIIAFNRANAVERGQHALH